MSDERASLGEPFCVQPGWVRSELIEQYGGPSYRLLFYEGDPINGEANNWVAFEHRCDRGERGVIICAPALSDGHVLTWVPDQAGRRLRPTVHPSIVCPDCGTHGFVRAGRWAS